MEDRERAVSWWKLLSPFEKEKFTNAVFTKREPSSLTGREIEMVYASAKRNALRTKIITELTLHPNVPSYEMLLKAAVALGLEYVKEDKKQGPPFIVE